MKKQLIIVGIIVLLVSVWLSGCEVIEENNYVAVTVDASVSIRLLDKNGAEVLNKNLSGIPIIIEMVKEGENDSDSSESQVLEAQMHKVRFIYTKNK